MLSKTLRCPKGGLTAALWFFLAVTSVAARELEPRIPVPTAEPVRHSATAFAAGRFLTVWEQQTAGRRHIFGALADETGRRISEASFPLIRDTTTDFLSLISLGDAFALIWRDFTGHHLAEIDTDGRVRSRKTLQSSWGSRDGSWNGRHLLAFRRIGESFVVEGGLLDRAGNVVRSGIPLFGPGVPREVITRADGSFVVFLSDPYTPLAAVTISPDGVAGQPVVIERPGGMTTTDYYPATPAAIEVAGGDLLVAWVGRQHDRPAQLKTARMATSSGEVSTPVVLPVTGYLEIDSLKLVNDQEGLILFFAGTRESAGESENRELGGLRIDPSGNSMDAGTSIIDRGSGPGSVFTFASNGDTTLAVTYSFNPPPSPIVSYALHDLSARRPTVLSLTASKQEQIRIGANAVGYVAVWNDFIGQGTSVRAAAVDSSGALISSPSIYPGHLVSQRLASGPSDHLFLRGTSGHLIASRIDSDGRPLRDAVIGPPMATADAVWTGAGYLIVTTVSSRIFTAFLAGDGPVASREIALPVVPEGYGRSAPRVTVAFDGRTALLIWSETISRVCGFPGSCQTGDTTMMALRLTAAGEPIDLAPLAIKPVRGFNGLLAGGDGEFLFYTGDDRSVRILRSDAAGLHLGPPKPVSQDYYILEDVTWNGTRFTVALRAMTEYLSIAHFDRQGNFTWQPGAARTHGTATQSVRIAARGDQFLIGAAVAEAAVPFRAHVFNESDLAPLPPPPPPTAVTSVEAAPNGGAVVSWVRVPGADGYTVEAFTNGRFAIIGLAGEHETSKYTGWPMNHQFRVRAFNAGGFSVDWPRRRSVRH